MTKKRLYLIIAVAMIGALISLALLYQHHTLSGEAGFVDMICGGGAGTGCDAVNRSDYSSLAGIPVAAAGMLFYLCVASLVIAALRLDHHPRRAVLRLVAWGVWASLAVDLALLAVQIFLVGELCWLCMSTYAAGIVLLLLLMGKKGDRPEGGVLAALKPGVLGRKGLVPPVAGLLLACVVAVAAEVTLSIVFAPPTVEELEAQAVAQFNLLNPVPMALVGVPSKGNPSAPIQIVIFSDFLCPYCQQVALYFKKHLPEWEDRISLKFLNYPLDRLCNPFDKKGTHPGACWAALGGLCAQEQGLFWEFHDRIFEAPPVNPSGQRIMEIAHEIGVDTTRMKTCLTSTDMRRKVKLQIEQAVSYGVNGTPRVFINGKLIPKLAALPAILRSEGARLGITPLEHTEVW